MEDKAVPHKISPLINEILGLVDHIFPNTGRTRLKSKIMSNLTTGIN